MQSITYEEINNFIEEIVISAYFQKKVDTLNKVSLPQLLSRRNPSLFILKNVEAPEEFVAELLEAYILPLEEVLLGSLLERLAISICQKAFAGHISAMQGIDLEFERDAKYYIVAIKSGPNWGNTVQIARMIQSFREAKELLRAGGNTEEIIVVNGCCYGKDSKPNKGEYVKLCGQSFWELISGDKNMFSKITAALNEITKRKDQEYKDAYKRKIGQLTDDMRNGFMTNGQIDWTKVSTPEYIDIIERITVANERTSRPSFISTEIENIANAHPANIQEVAASQIAINQDYYENALEQTKRSFRPALFLSITGTVIIFGAVILIIIGIVLLALRQPTELSLASLAGGFASLIAGVVINVVARLSFSLYGRTLDQLTTFQTPLDRVSRFLIANSVCENIEGELKNQTRANLVNIIASGTTISTDGENLSNGARQQGKRRTSVSRIIKRK